MFRYAEQSSRPARSALYVPGDRPDRMRTALDAGADVVVIDLEDAVAPQRRDDARQEIALLLSALDTAPAARIDVRCNRVADGWDAADLDVAVHPAVGRLRLAKAEDPRLVCEVAARVSALEADRGLTPGGIGLDLLVESARGVQDAASMAAADPRVRQLCLGGADLARDLGADRGLATADPLLLSRQLLVLASRANGLPGPTDTVCTVLDDDDLVEAEARAARALGFTGKSVIHPRQIAPVHRAFAPTADQLAWAEKVQQAWAAARRRGDATAVVDGEFVDDPVAARADQILSLASHSQGTP